MYITQVQAIQQLLWRDAYHAYSGYGESFNVMFITPIVGKDVKVQKKSISLALPLGNPHAYWV